MGLAGTTLELFLCVSYFLFLGKFENLLFSLMLTLLHRQFSLELVGTFKEYLFDENQSLVSSYDVINTFFLSSVNLSSQIVVLNLRC